MEFGKIHVKIRGLTPLLMNKPDPEEFRKPKPLTPAPKEYIPEKEARKAAYITEVDGKEQLYIPSSWLYSMIVKAGVEYKQKGRRASLMTLLAGTIRVEPEKILLGTNKYEIDERFGIIQRARVLIWRPRIEEWKAEFDIIYNKLYLDNPKMLETLHDVLEDGGVRLGIGDYRPQHKGWFGTFTVEEFELES